MILWTEPMLIRRVDYAIGPSCVYKKIVFNDSYIEYKEKNDKSDSSGKVSFSMSLPHYIM
jgi:hypothetical protein